MFDYSHQVSLVSILHAPSIIVPYPPSVYLLQKIAACVPSFSLTYFQCHMLYFSWNSAFLTIKHCFLPAFLNPSLTTAQAVIGLNHKRLVCTVFLRRIMMY